MENTVLSKNLNILSRYNRDLAQNLSNIAELTGNFQMKEAKSGDSILFKDGRAFDDALDPVLNALERYNKLEFKSIKSITILYGLGLGYILKEFAKRYKGKIIVFEPNLEVLRISMELVDFSDELKNSNIRITSSYDEIKNAYLDLFFKDYELNIVPINYYETAELKETAEFKEQIERIHGTFQSNYRNLIEKAHNWTLCLFNNIPNAIKTQDLHTLKNIHKGKTAVIIAAGPSLDKNIQDLKPYRDKVIVFCVGTALKTAIKHGIIPDFVVTIETALVTKHQLDVPEIQDTVIISATNSFKGIFELKPKGFLNYHSNKDAASKWLGDLLKLPIDDYEAAGTVSITALYSAKFMGIDKIIFIGQDLAYTDNKCYSKDSHYGGYSVKGENDVSISDSDKVKEDLKLSETRLNSHMKNLGKNLFSIRAYNGDRVMSRSDLILFITYFEEIAKEHGSEITFVNSTEGGAYIKGFEHIPLKESLAKYTGEDISRETPLNLLKLDGKELKKRKNTVLNELKGIVRNYYELKEILDKTVNNNILPCLNPETIKKYEEFTSFHEYRHELYHSKFLNNISYSEEEEKALYDDKQNEKNKEFALSAKKDIENLLEKNPEKFAQNLKIIKDNYFKMKSILDRNDFFKSLIIGTILVTDNAIKDFENNDANLIRLFHILNLRTFIDTFIKVKSYGKFIKNVVKELEPEK